MQLHQPLRVVTPTVDGDVLAVLAQADAGFTPPQVHRLIGRHSEAGVRKALQRLARQGLVEAQRIGQAVVYSMNRRHLAAPYVTALARLFDELLERVREVVGGWAVKPEFVALFGSAARHEMRPDSDIDLLVVRPDSVPADLSQWREQLDELAERVTAWTGNDARVLELRREDVAVGMRDGEPLYDDLQRDAIRLLGPADYLRSLGRSLSRV